MTAPRLFTLAMLALSAAATCSSVMAKGLVAYYQVGGSSTSWVRWDTYVIDSDSLSRDGSYIRYKSFVITANGSPPPQDVKADCKSREHGLASGASMYATYPGTIDGEEVRVACELAERRDLLKN